MERGITGIYFDKYSAVSGRYIVCGAALLLCRPAECLGKLCRHLEKPLQKLESGMQNSGVEFDLTKSNIVCPILQSYVVYCQGTTGRRPYALCTGKETQGKDTVRKTGQKHFTVGFTAVLSEQRKSECSEGLQKNLNL